MTKRSGKIVSVTVISAGSLSSSSSRPVPLRLSSPLNASLPSVSSGVLSISTPSSELISARLVMIPVTEPSTTKLIRMLVDAQDRSAIGVL